MASRRELQQAEHRARAAERKAARADERLRETVEALPSGIVILDSDRRYVLWNKGYEEIYRDSKSSLQTGNRIDDTLRAGLARGSYPGAIGREEEWLEERLSRLDNPRGPHEQHLADGRWIMIDERRTADGGSIGIRVDVSDAKRREASLRILFDSNPVPMVVYDRHNFELISVNNAAIALYGFTREQALAMRLEDIVVDPMERQTGRVESFGHTHRQRKADGSLFDAAVMSREIESEGRLAVLMSVVDMTERKRAEDRVAYMARHDALTDLPNRVFYRERVDALLSKSAEQGFALLLVDLDEFKAVNDSLGHQMGDLVLRAVAERLSMAVTGNDLVARLGGDEFAIVLAGVTAREDVQAFARRLLQNLNRPYTAEGNSFSIGASIGAAMAPADADSASRLLKCADLALYRAKADGRGLARMFEGEMDAAAQTRRALEFDLRRAIAGDALEVRYQPLVNLKTGRISGFEALCRWTHPERGPVSPSVFIGIAEEIGVIDQLSELVLRKACNDAMTWPEDVRLAVNLSPVQFRTGNVLALVLYALEASGLDPSRLEIEITESLVIEDSESTLATLHDLRALGVGIAMDDFGTGYSSLSSLRSFPFSKIKIDQTFIRGLSDRPDSQAIVRAIVGLGRSLQMAVMAEGVEEQQDLAMLLAEGCVEAQGYFFSPAQPAAEVRELLKGNRFALDAVAEIVSEHNDRQGETVRRRSGPRA